MRGFALLTKAVAGFLYGIASMIRWALFKSFGVDVFNPGWVIATQLLILSAIILFFIKSIMWWVKRARPMAKFRPTGIAIFGIMFMVGMGYLMGTTTAILPLFAFPTTKLDALPVLADLYKTGLHDGSALSPGVMGAVTVGRAKLLMFVLMNAQAALTLFFEPNWVLAFLFPNARPEFEINAPEVTGNQRVDGALDLFPLILSFLCTMVDLVLSAAGMAASGHSIAVIQKYMAGFLVRILLWFGIFGIAWLVMLLVMFALVSNQLKHPKNRIKL